jgi:alkanesulfonate monooxygenase SsuD/methylene tetrahydromethanopterin reductase-like flavin-dependent oxidoreductase (luciferase family)
MRYGFVLPSGDAADVGELAAVAEHAGWDGLFVWEAVWGVDAWVSLAVAAVATSTIRLGTMLTPLPRRRPWDLASQTATVDRLSGGRVVLSVGLGAVHPGWTAFEADPGRKVRAELLDEGLDVLTGLWAGQPFAYEGTHHRVTPTDFAVPAPPVQRPRIPVWCVGLDGSTRSMGRAARWDGLLPMVRDTGGVRQPTPAELPGVIARAHALRRDQGIDGGLDVIVEGVTAAEDPDAGAATTAAWAAAGATWFIQADWSEGGGAVDASRTRLEAGPPRH